MLFFPGNALDYIYLTLWYPPKKNKERKNLPPFFVEGQNLYIYPFMSDTYPLPLVEVANLYPSEPFKNGLGPPQKNYLYIYIYTWLSI